MKNLFGAFITLYMLVVAPTLTDLNPLLLWDGYRKFVNIYLYDRPLVMMVVYGVLFVIILFYKWQSTGSQPTERSPALNTE